MDKNYKFAIMQGTTIKLFNNSIQESTVLNSDFLEDVNIDCGSNGVLDITANRISFDWYPYREHGFKIYEKDWKRQPHRSAIHEGRRWWKSLFRIGKKERFVCCGWVRTTETEPVHYIISNYRVEVYD